MRWTYDDGGRHIELEAGRLRAASAGDCAVRAAAIATGRAYREVYDAINELAKLERPRGKRSRSTARDGVWPRTLGRYLEPLGFAWTATMGIGTGCTVHLANGELPAGRLVARVSRHYVAVMDDVIHDTHDPSREGTRCVYGYWANATT